MFSFLNFDDFLDNLRGSRGLLGLHDHFGCWSFGWLRNFLNNYRPLLDLLLLFLLAHAIGNAVDTMASQDAIPVVEPAVLLPQEALFGKRVPKLPSRLTAGQGCIHGVLPLATSALLMREFIVGLRECEFCPVQFSFDHGSILIKKDFAKVIELCWNTLSSLVLIGPACNNHSTINH